MNLENCFRIGQIIKAHGIKGEVVIETDEEHPEEFSELESVFIEINQKLVPFFIEEIQVNGKRAIVLFEDIHSVEETKILLRKQVYVNAGQLPEEGQFYHEALLGFTVRDKAKGEIGPVKEYVERPGQDLLVADYQGREVLIPVDPSIILRLDRKKKIISVNLPEGLLDL